MKAIAYNSTTDLIKIVLSFRVVSEIIVCVTHFIRNVNRKMSD